MSRLKHYKSRSASPSYVPSYHGKPTTGNVDSRQNVQISICDFTDAQPCIRAFNEKDFVHKGIGNLLAQKEAAEQSKRMQEQMIEEYQAMMYGYLSGTREYEYVQDIYGNFIRQPIASSAVSTAGQNSRLLPDYKPNYPLYDEVEPDRSSVADQSAKSTQKPKLPVFLDKNVPVFSSPVNYEESASLRSETTQEDSLDQLERGMQEYRRHVLSKHNTRHKNNNCPGGSHHKCEFKGKEDASTSSCADNKSKTSIESRQVLSNAKHKYDASVSKPKMKKSIGRSSKEKSKSVNIKQDANSTKRNDIKTALKEIKRAFSQNRSRDDSLETTTKKGTSSWEDKRDPKRLSILDIEGFDNKSNIGSNLESIKHSFSKRHGSVSCINQRREKYDGSNMILNSNEIKDNVSFKSTLPDASKAKKPHENSYSLAAIKKSFVMLKKSKECLQSTDDNKPSKGPSFVFTKKASAYTPSSTKANCHQQSTTMSVASKCGSGANSLTISHGMKRASLPQKILLSFRYDTSSYMENTGDSGANVKMPILAGEVNHTSHRKKQIQITLFLIICLIIAISIYVLNSMVK